MILRRLPALASLCFALLVAACGGGSGRGGTDVAVSASGPTDAVVSGTAVVFVMTVANVGENNANDVSIVNVIGNQLALTGITCAASNGATCPEASVAMSVPELPRGGVLTFQVSATVTQGANGVISDTMTANFASDVDRSNNSATASASATSNNVAVAVTAPAGPLTDAGAVFTAVVSNTGPGDAHDVTLTTTLSTNTTPAGDVSCVPAGGAAAPTLQGDGSLLSALVPVNGTLTCTIPTTVTAGTNAPVFAQAVVSATGDAKASDNTSTASVDASLINDVSVVVTAPSGAVTGSAATFAAVIANAGPSTAQNVQIVTTLSANLSRSGAIACTAAGGATVPDAQNDGSLLAAAIPANGSLTCSIPTTVAPGTNGLVFAQVAASADQDARTGNNVSTASASATLTNNVAITASVPPGTLVGGASTVFTAVITNSGPSAARDVDLNTTLSANLTQSGTLSCAAAGGAAVPVPTNGTTLRSALVPVGGVLTCTAPVTVAAGANGTVFATFTVDAASDQRSADNSATASISVVSSNLGVSQSAAAQVPAGSASAFTAVVVNPAGGNATNVVITWTHTEPTGVTFAAPTCVATGGATCPAVLGPTMTVPVLGPGRSLNFTFAVTTDDAARGAIVNTVSVTSTEDTDTSNNTATSTLQAVDARNGSYVAFLADGRPYDLSIDFDAGSYTLSGNGQSSTRSFAVDGNGDYVVAGNARLRAATDLLVGSHDFGNGPVPFVAARNFMTSLAGSFNLATLNVPGVGAAVTHPGTAAVSGNTLQVCQSDTAAPAPPGSCAPGDLKSYTISADASTKVFTGIQTTTPNEVITFRVARSGAVNIVLSAYTAGDGSQQLRIGLPNAAAIAGGSLRGPSTTGDWTAVELTASSAAVSGGTTAYNVRLTDVNSAIGSMRRGPRDTDSAVIYALQASPLAVLLGSINGTASGLLQLALP